MATKRLLLIVMAVMLTAGFAIPAQAEPAKEFTLVSAMVAEGANLWLPSTLIVQSGDEIKLTLRNTAKVEHGFSIKELGVQEVVQPGETKQVTIKPSSIALLRYTCHLHPAHIGGQLMVQ